jgi:ethylmalonyl-CoA/methylmalonyl-CoA decarboxylase
MRQLADCVDSLHTDPAALAVCIMGANDCFCAGADFSLAREVVNTSDRGLLMCDFMTDVTWSLLSLDAPVVAVIDGPAIGGGAELTTASDFRIGTVAICTFVSSKTVYAARRSKRPRHLEDTMGSR